MQNAENLPIIGEYHAFGLPDWVTEDSEIIKRLRDYIRQGKPLAELKRMIQWSDYRKNLIPTVGRNVLARLLAGDTSYSGEVDYGALGSGSTAFTNASTELNTEVYRKQAASQAFDDNITYIDWFIAAGDVGDQTFQEFGAFIDGTGSADSGQAWSLLITGGWVKSGSMFISGKYTLTN